MSDERGIRKEESFPIPFRVHRKAPKDTPRFSGERNLDSAFWAENQEREGRASPSHNGTVAEF